MNIYEVVRWGHEASPDGPNGEDTCFLVRASSVEEAARIIDTQHLIHMPATKVRSWAAMVLCLGEDMSSKCDPEYLRGPYVQDAYNHGYRCWHRDEPGGPWYELEAT